MSDTIELRDHSQPCKHSEQAYTAHQQWYCSAYACPGGKRIVLKVRKSRVYRRIWGPGDTYLAVDDDQVFDLKEGDRVQRFQSDWVEVSDDE